MFSNFKTVILFALIVAMLNSMSHRRMAWSVYTLAALALIGMDTNQTQAQPFAELHQRMRGGVVLIQAKGAGRDERTATGFLVEESGIVLTSRHVLDGSRSVFATFPGRNANPIRCGLVDESRRHDLAALKLSRVLGSPPVFRLDRNANPQALEDVLIIGHPKQLEWTVHQGRVSGRSR